MDEIQVRPGYLQTVISGVDQLRQINDSGNVWQTPAADDADYILILPAQTEQRMPGFLS
jgi:hypothetical protein